MSAFNVRYVVEFLSIGKCDSKTTIEVLPTLRISSKKLRRGFKQRMKERGRVSLEYPTGQDEEVGYP